MGSRGWIASTARQAIYGGDGADLTEGGAGNDILCAGNGPEDLARAAASGKLTPGRFRATKTAASFRSLGLVASCKRGKASLAHRKA